MKILYHPHNEEEKRSLLRECKRGQGLGYLASPHPVTIPTLKYIYKNVDLNMSPY